MTAEDLRDIAETLMWKACENLRDEGHLTCVAGIMHGITMTMRGLEGDGEKRRRTIMRLVRKYGADGIVIVSDCFFTQHTHDSGLSFDQMPLRSEDPRRQEVVCVFCIPWDEEGLTLLRPYRRIEEDFESGHVQRLNGIQGWAAGLWQRM